MGLSFLFSLLTNVSQPSVTLGEGEGGRGERKKKKTDLLQFLQNLVPTSVVPVQSFVQRPRVHEFSLAGVIIILGETARVRVRVEGGREEECREK